MQGITKQEVIQELAERTGKHPSEIESAIRGGFDTLTFGLAPKASSAIGAGLVKLADPNSSFKDNYQIGRDYLRQQNSTAAQENPLSYGLGALFGGFSNPLTKGVNTIKGAIGAGGAYGTAYGLGSSDKGEVGSIGSENLLDATLNGLMGAGFGAAGQTVINKALIPGFNAISSSKYNPFKSNVPIEPPQAEVSRPLEAPTYNVQPSQNLSKISNNVKGITRTDTPDSKTLYDVAKNNIGKLQFKILEGFNNNFNKVAGIRLNEEALTPENAPNTYNHLKAFNDLFDSTSKEPKEVSFKNIDEFRNALNNAYQSAKGKDKNGIEILKNELNGYLDNTIERAIIRGFEDHTSTAPESSFSKAEILKYLQEEKALRQSNKEIKQ